MSNKVANLIALELGVVIALLAWLAFSNLRTVKQQPVAQQPTRAVDSFATVAPVLSSINRRQAPVDYRADVAPEPPEDEPAAQAEPEYQQAVYTEPAATSGLSTGYVTATVPSYTLFDPQSRIPDSDCLDSFPDQFVVYSQPSAILVVPNSRTFARRPRSPFRTAGTRPPIGHQRPPTIQHSRPRERNITPRSKTQRQPSRPSPKLRPRQNP
ncbi:MAG TPA: hypothetical protein VGL24_08065 [Chthoniobacterales bacterium]